MQLLVVEIIYGVSTLTPSDETIYTNVAAGVLSGAISSAVANPTDVLKVRNTPCRH